MARPSRLTDAPASPIDWAALEARIVAALDPIHEGSAFGVGMPGSDVDLNPGLVVPVENLAASAVLAALIRTDQGFNVLLTRRADQMRRHAGQIAFPGGRCDPGETPWETALREAQEEVGLDPAAVRLAGLSTPYRTLTGYHITPVVGFLDARPALVLNPDEVAETFEVPLDFLLDAANYERRHRDQPPGPPRWHYAISHGGRTIWGATAGMLRALRDRLETPDAG
jgi:8-oxo-dGTP pyrophosphatase MutT (NUDIX family)